MTPPRPPRHAAPARGAATSDTSPDRATEADGAAAPKRKWKLNVATLIVGLIALAGLFGAMYPSTAAWWSQWNESRAIRGYQQQIKLDPPPGNALVLDAAHEYNSRLSKGDLAIEVGSNRPELLGQVDDGSGYWEQLNSDPDGIMARLTVPSIDVDLPIYHGTSDAVLEHGVGHLQGTSLPVGGTDTHSVLTAHTGLAKATLFNNLKDVELGDTFTISVFGEVLTYQVVETQTILPEETGSLIIQSDRDIITLVTCTPLGINTHRYLVTGERIEPTPIEDIKAAEAGPVIPRFPWWAVILPAGVILVGVYVWRTGYPPKPKKVKGGAGVAGAAFSREAG